MFRKLGIAALGGLFLFFAGACSDDDNPSALIRALHLSSDAPPVDVYAAGDPVPLALNISFGEASQFFAVPPGSYQIELRGAGAMPDSQPVYTSPTVTVVEGDRVTAIAAGLFAQGTPAESAFRLIPLFEDFDAPGAGEAIARIVHTAADAGTVNLDLGDDGSSDLTGLARFAATDPAGLSLPAGSSLQVAILAGETRVTGFTTPGLSAGNEYFIAAAGLLGKLPREDDGFALLAVDQNSNTIWIHQNPTVYALHAGSDAPAVDIYAGETRLVFDLDFGQISEPVQVPPGSYTLDFTESGETDIAASAATPVLSAGQTYLAVAAGRLGNMSFTLMPAAENFTLDPTKVFVVVGHGSDDAPTVDVGSVSGNTFTPVPDFAGLSFGDFSADDMGTELPDGRLTIGIAGAGSTETVAEFTVDLPVGLRAFAIAAGSYTGAEGSETFKLILVDAAGWGIIGVLDPDVEEPQ
jgi:hypothetical protein